MLYGKTYKLNNVKTFEELIFEGWTKNVEDGSIWLKNSKTGDLYEIIESRPVFHKTEDKVIVHQVTNNDFLILKLACFEDDVEPLWFAHFRLSRGITDRKYNERFDVAGSIIDCDFDGTTFETRMLTDTIVLLRTKKQTYFYDMKNVRISYRNFTVEVFSDGFIGKWDEKCCVQYFNPFTYEPITPCYSRLRQKCLEITSLDELRILERNDDNESRIGEEYRNTVPILSFENAKKILLEKNGLVEEREPERVQCPFIGRILTYSKSIIRPEITENQIVFHTKEKITVMELGEECLGLNQIGEGKFLIVSRSRDTYEYTLRAISISDFTLDGHVEELLAGPSKDPNWFLSPDIFVDDDRLCHFTSKFKDWHLWKTDKRKTILIRDNGMLRPYHIHYDYYNESFHLVDFCNRRIGGIYIVGPNQFFKDKESIIEYKKEAKIAEEIVEQPTRKDQANVKKLKKIAEKVMKEYCKTNHIPL